MAQLKHARHIAYTESCRDVAEVTVDTLEQRITRAFSDRAVTSSEVAKLIAETEEAITAAEAAAEQARAAMEDAAFGRDRLRTVLPRLQRLLKEVEAEEYAAAWEAEYKRVKVIQDELAAEMSEVYPAAVAS
jgi:chromosome segregation ATPase